MDTNTPAGADPPTPPPPSAPPTTLQSANQLVLDQRVRRSRCSKCGYSLAGLTPSALCPECSQPVALSLSPIDPSYPLSFHRPCAQCSTNLFNIATHSACPECGFPVADSLRGFALSAADLAVLSSTRRALSHASYAILAGFILAPTTLLYYALDPLPGTLLNDLIVAVLSFALIAAMFFAALDHWRLALPEIIYDHHRQSTSTPARVSIFISFGAIAVLLLIELVPLIWPVSREPPLFSIELALLLAACIATFVSFFLIISRIGRLAELIPDFTLLTRINNARSLLPLLSIFGAPFLLLGPVIALFLYWRLLYHTRASLDTLLAAHSPIDTPIAHPPSSPAT